MGNNLFPKGLSFLFGACFPSNRDRFVIAGYSILSSFFDFCFTACLALSITYLVNGDPPDMIYQFLDFFFERGTEKIFLEKMFFNLLICTMLVSSLLRIRLIFVRENLLRIKYLNFYNLLSGKILDGDFSVVTSKSSEDIYNVLLYGARGSFIWLFRPFLQVSEASFYLLIVITSYIFSGYTTALLCLIFVGSFYAISTRLISMRIRRVSSERNIHNKRIISLLGNFCRYASEIFLNERSKSMVSLLQDSERVHRSKQTEYLIWSQLPRAGLDFILVVCILTLYLWFGSEQFELGESVSVLALVTFRAVPYVNNLYKAGLSISSNSHVIRDVFDIFSMAQSSQETDKQIARESVSGLGKSCALGFGVHLQFNPSLISVDIGSAKPPNVEKIDRLIGVSGESGVGKSSLLKSLFAPEYSRFSGNMRLFSHGFRLCYIGESDFFVNDSVLANLGISETDISSPLVRKCLEITRVLPIAEAYKSRAIGLNGCKLSSGERQRVSFCRTILRLVGESDVILVLDEALSQLPIELELKIIGDVLKLDCFAALLVCSHRPEVIDRAVTQIEFLGENSIFLRN